MLNLKKTLTKLLSQAKQTDQKFESELVATLPYTSSTTWTKVGNFTITEDGIYRIRASYSNAGVNGLAISLTQHTTITQCDILAENTTSATVSAVAYLNKNTSYSAWTKCGQSGKSNSVQVTKLVGLS